MVNLVFLLRFITGMEERRKEILLDGIFYVLTAILIFLSESATGKILFLLLNFSVFMVFLWLKVRKRLNTYHYWVGAALLLILSVIAFLNLDHFLGLFNRNITLTGRVYLWEYLFNEVIPKRLYFGYGFGAIWVTQSFQTQVSRAIGWPYPVLMADNGYIDILLNGGGIGFTLFFAVMVSLIIRSIRYVVRNKSLYGFFPVFFLEFILIENMVYSFFMELETFVWLIFVTILFLTTHDSLKVKTDAIHHTA